MVVVEAAGGEGVERFWHLISLLQQQVAPSHSSCSGSCCCSNCIPWERMTLARITWHTSTKHLAPSIWHLAHGTKGSVRESQNNRPNISSLCSAKLFTHCRRRTSSILVFILTLKTSSLEHIRQTMCRVFQYKWPSIYLARWSTFCKLYLVLSNSNR